MVKQKTKDNQAVILLLQSKKPLDYISNKQFI